MVVFLFQSLWPLIIWTGIIIIALAVFGLAHLLKYRHGQCPKCGSPAKQVKGWNKLECPVCGKTWDY